jgi:hypothetical protein
MRHVALITALAGWLLSMPCAAQTPPTATGAEAQASAAEQPIGGDSQYALALGGAPLGPSWAGSDERWYQRNRRFAIAGKVLTVLGIGLLLGAVTTEHDGLVIGAIVTQYGGQLIWAASELRGANELRRRGFRVSRTSAMVALCGALLLSPLTWIAGPIQSAQIRQAHASLSFARSESVSFASYGVGFRGSF